MITRLGKWIEAFIIKVSNRESRSKSDNIDLRKNAIYIIGDMVIRDKSGEDISNRFPGKLKELLGLLIITTLDSGGINSTDIERRLWPMKSSARAVNNRGANISRLRRALKDLDGISIVNRSGVWSLDMDDRLFSDYRVIVDNSVSAESLSNRNRLLSKGVLLKGLNSPWIDDTRANFANVAITNLEEGIEEAFVNNRLDEVIDLTESIFSIEPLNELALRVKCRILHERGRLTLAKRSYDNFCIAYRELYKTNFHTEFSRLIA